LRFICSSSASLLLTALGGKVSGGLVSPALGEGRPVTTVAPSEDFVWLSAGAAAFGAVALSEIEAGACSPVALLLLCVVEQAASPTQINAIENFSALLDVEVFINFVLPFGVEPKLTSVMKGTYRQRPLQIVSGLFQPFLTPAPIANLRADTGRLSTTGVRDAQAGVPRATFPLVHFAT